MLLIIRIHFFLCLAPQHCITTPIFTYLLYLSPVNGIDVARG